MYTENIVLFWPFQRMFHLYIALLKMDLVAANLFLGHWVKGKNNDKLLFPQLFESSFLFASPLLLNTHTMMVPLNLNHVCTRSVLSSFTLATFFNDSSHTKSRYRLPDARADSAIFGIHRILFLVYLEAMRHCFCYIWQPWDIFFICSIWQSWDSAFACLIA